MSTGYITVITGKFITDSPLLISDGRSDGSIDKFIQRDGSGAIFLPGSSIAGALLQTAARICPDLFSNSEKFNQITMKTNGKSPEDNSKDKFRNSRWKISSCYPENKNIEPWIRQGVSIIQKSSTKKEHALYNFEFIPPGTVFPFEFEVDTGNFHNPDSHNSAKLARDLLLLSLREWQNGYGFLGGQVSRGLGRITPAEIKVFDIPASDVMHWPDTGKTIEEASNGKDWICKDWKSNLKSDFNNSWHRIKINISITAGKTEWGWDSIAVASGDWEKLRFDINDKPDTNTRWKFAGTGQDYTYFVTSSDEDDESKSNLPDHLLPTDGKGSVIIPGSSIRGILRHMLSAIERSSRVNIEDPAVSEFSCRDDNHIKKLREDLPDDIARLFGFNEHDGHLLIPDAVSSDVESALFQNHAEDEFTAGSFGSALFNREVIMSGRFSTDIIIEAPDSDELIKYANLFEKLNVLSKNNLLPLGGGTARGHGWPSWKFTVSQSTHFGEVTR
ncbi:MAG: hypothetical protein JXR95_04385 [Deltaproteobacteria bacterium]|nr:hypothetical protein [Deltaproteobacteria bacterium]